MKSKVAAQLLIHDIQVNGLKALIYCYGLSASRYIEYAGALRFLSHEARPRDMILEAGCGHSILPAFWQKLRLETAILDTSRPTLSWQVRKTRELGTHKLTHAILADMAHLPFKDESFTSVSCISSIEHIPADGDIKASAEIGRVLKSNGICVISIPLSHKKESYVEKHWAAEIPRLIQSLLIPCLPTILREFNVDRTGFYFERFFSCTDVNKRIVEPSECQNEEYSTLRSGTATKSLYQKIVPTGVLTIVEYVMAEFLVTTDQPAIADAIILKLRKKPRKGDRSGKLNRKLNAARFQELN